MRTSAGTMANLYKGLLLLTGLLSLEHTAQAAEKVDAKRLLQHAMIRQRRMTLDPDQEPYRFKRQADELDIRDLDDVMSLGGDARVDVVRVSQTVQGTRLVKLQEKYKDAIVPDGVITLETDSDGERVFDASGSLYRHIGPDLAGTNVLVPEKALAACLEYHSDEGFEDVIKHVKVEPEVLFDDEERALPAYLIDYLVLGEGVGEGAERRPACLMDARDGRVREAWDALDTRLDCKAHGTGGNEQVGRIRYGEELQRCLDLRREKGACYLENSFVRVVDNNYTWQATGDESQVPDTAAYDCVETGDEVNGAFSPLLDGLFYGTVVGRMFHDWYGQLPIGEQMTFRVHYGVNFTNARWTGYECQFGDGADAYHPFVTLDIVGHEVGHAVTELASGLLYFQQWGAVNEAFSDMMGEAAEAYLDQADWRVGVYASKDGQPVRYFASPEADNASIAHAEDFVDYMEVHLASGVYNHAFYLLVHDYGLPIRHAFHVFLLANQMYWHHMSDFDSAACDVMKAAYDLGQDGALFRRAFREVGVAVCDVSDHVLGLRNGEPRGNVTVSSQASASFTFAVPGEFASHVTVSASSPHGNVYVTLSSATWGSDDDEEEKVYAKGLGVARFDLTDNVTQHFYVRLWTDSDDTLTDVTVTASYACVTEFDKGQNDAMKEYMYLVWDYYCGQELDMEDQDQDDYDDCDDDKVTNGDDDDGKEANGNNDDDKDTKFDSDDDSKYGFV